MSVEELMPAIEALVSSPRWGRWASALFNRCSEGASTNHKTTAMTNSLTFAIVLVSLFFIAPWAWAEKGEESYDAEENEVQQGAEDIIDHAPFEEILEKYVDERGMVDYAGLRDSAEDLEKLHTYVRAIGAASVSGSERAAQKAFLINAYNALVIFDVLQRWPVENVLEEEGFFDGRRHRVGGVRMTLDRLEKRMLHARFGDGRTHFAVVCAARSCPRLQTTAFTAQNVEELLESIAGEYVPRVTSLEDGGAVKTSQLFEWYEDSFSADAQSVAAFLARYVDDEELRRALNKKGVEIRYSEYDWRINAQ